MGERGAVSSRCSRRSFAGETGVIKIARHTLRSRRRRCRGPCAVVLLQATSQDLGALAFTAGHRTLWCDDFLNVRPPRRRGFLDVRPYFPPWAPSRDPHPPLIDAPKVQVPSARASQFHECLPPFPCMRVLMSPCLFLELHASEAIPSPPRSSFFRCSSGSRRSHNWSFAIAPCPCSQDWLAHCVVVARSGVTFPPGGVMAA